MQVQMWHETLGLSELSPSPVNTGRVSTNTHYVMQCYTSNHIDMHIYMNTYVSGLVKS